MIKEKNVLININSRNINIYKELGYDVTNIDKLLNVSIVDVSKFSKIRITAICSICNTEKDISINKYWLNFYRGGYNFYSCFNCKNKKKEMTSIKNFGETSFSKTDEFKVKFKETSIKNYGVDNPNKNIDIRNKIKKTNIEKYGVVTSLILPDNIKKAKNWMSSDEFRSKSRETLVDKYGFDSFSKTDMFKKKIQGNKVIIIEKIKNTFMERYGVDWFSKTDISKYNHKLNIARTEERRKKTCIEKYGVDNVSKDENIYSKIYKSKIDSGYTIHDDNLSEWKSYRRKVGRLTNRVKKLLFENWNGYDYYDNEFIKGNFSYSHTNRLFPTIDHKISTIFGFNNNIPEEEIASLKNLCITKRYINSAKGSLIESIFNINI